MYTLIPTVYRALLKSAVSGTDHRIHTTKKTPLHYNTALGKKQSPLPSAAVRDRLSTGLCQCKYTNENLLFLRPNTIVLQHCLWQQAITTVQCCCTKQDDSMLVPLLLHLGRFVLRTGVQCHNTNALQHRSGETHPDHFSVLLCKTGSQHACDTAICCSYRCAVTQHQRTAALFLVKCSPHRSVLLCKIGLQQACITAITPMKFCCSYR